MTVTEERTVITEPGIYPDLSNEAYHADPVPEGSLSASGTKLLLPPSAPALFKWRKENPEPYKAAFDLGTAAHQLVLGAGTEICEVKHDSWRSNDAKQQAAVARFEDKVPLLSKDVAVVKAMAAKIQENDLARALFSQGMPEQSLFWQDGPTGVWRRARIDWLREPKDGRLIIVDYKSAVSAEPRAFTKATLDYGYFRQSPWYKDGAQALGLADDVRFVFVVQEKTEPYLVQTYELTDEFERIGRSHNRDAIDLYARCMAEDHWPGYGDDVLPISPPDWLSRQFEATH